MWENDDFEYDYDDEDDELDFDSIDNSIIPMVVLKKAQDKKRRYGSAKDGWKPKEDKILIQVYPNGRLIVKVNDLVDFLFKYGGSGVQRTRASIFHRVRKLKEWGLIPFCHKQGEGRLKPEDLVQIDKLDDDDGW